MIKITTSNRIITHFKLKNAPASLISNIFETENDDDDGLFDFQIEHEPGNVEADFINARNQLYGDEISFSLDESDANIPKAFKEKVDSFFNPLIESETIKDMEDEDYDIEWIVASENGNSYQVEREFEAIEIDVNQLRLNFR